MTARPTFDAAISRAYSSPSQVARVLTEHWTHRNLYCPNCGEQTIDKLPNNRPVADFTCRVCNEEYELKSKRGPFGRKLTDGAYATMMTRLAERNSPNLFLLSYAGSPPSVTTFSVIPRHFLTPSLIERRRPLAPTARRAGWVGCNIVLDGIPQAGRITLYRDAGFLPRMEVMELWQRTVFLRQQDQAATRGWLIHVMRLIEMVGTEVFSLADLYRHEDHLHAFYPGNNHIRPKIRQQLQRLRDTGYLRFVGRGTYQVTTIPVPAAPPTHNG